MTTKKEQRERMRQERLAAERVAANADKRRLYLGYAVAGVMVAAVLAGIVVLIAGGGEGDEVAPGISSNEIPELAHVETLIGSVPEGIEFDGREGTTPPPVANADLETAAKKADCELQLDLDEEGNTHFSDDQKKVNYKTAPPTSGDHYGVPTETGSGALADGAYLETPPISRAVHALEHGRVAIQYSPDLSEAEQLELKGLFDESPEGVVFYPNPDMPFDVAAAAWTQLIGCESYQGSTTLDAIRAFRDIYRGQGPEPFPLAVSG